MASKLTEGNAEIAKQLERAKAVLAVSRAKLEAQEQAEAGLVVEEEEEKSVPFFAMDTADENGKKDKVVKDKNEAGLFTTDGDLMAKLSEEEEWESRSLLEVFEDEKEKKPVSMNVDRDIAASMYNLRKHLQTDDFMKIFDKRNFFIGDPWKEKISVDLDLVLFVGSKLLFSWVWSTHLVKKDPNHLSVTWKRNEWIKTTIEWHCSI